MDNLDLKNITYGEILNEYENLDDSELTDSIFTDSTDLFGGKGKKGKKGKKMKKKSKKNKKKKQKKDDDDGGDDSDDSGSESSSSSRKKKSFMDNFDQQKIVEQQSQDALDEDSLEVREAEKAMRERTSEYTGEETESKYQTLLSFLGLSSSDTESSGGAKKKSPKKKSPKKKSSKKKSPKKASPKKASPKKGSPKKASPKSPKSHKKNSPKKGSPKSSKKNSPKKGSPKSPRKGSPKASQPRVKELPNVLTDTPADFRDREETVTTGSNETSVVKEQSKSQNLLSSLLPSSLTDTPSTSVARKELAKVVDSDAETDSLINFTNQVSKPQNNLLSELSASSANNMDSDDISKLVAKLIIQKSKQDVASRASSLHNEIQEGIQQNIATELAKEVATTEQEGGFSESEFVPKIRNNYYGGDETSIEEENKQVNTEELSATSDNKIAATAPPSKVSVSESSETSVVNTEMPQTEELSSTSENNNDDDDDKNNKYFNSSSDFYTTTIFENQSETQGVFNDIARGAQKLYSYIKKSFD